MEQCFDAYNKKLSTKTTVARQDVRDNKFAGYGDQSDILRCFACDGRDHRAVDCPSRASTSRNDLNSRLRQRYCYKFGLTGCDTKDRRNSLPRTQSTQSWSRGRSTDGPRLRLGKSHARCKCHERQKKRMLKEEVILYFGVEDRRKDQSA